MSDLQATIDRFRADAAVLRRNGETRVADVLDRCAREAESAAEEWLRWLPEADAVLRSGYSAAWLRARRRDTIL